MGLRCLQIFRTTRQARMAVGSKVPVLEERDIDLRDVRSKNKTMSKALGDAVQQVSDIAIKTACFISHCVIILWSIVKKLFFLVP